MRRARVDVKNEPTRCERIDELALLKRACIRAAEMKEEKKRERESYLQRATAKSLELGEYKITLSARRPILLSFFVL